MPNKKKCHQYSVEYLKFGFCESILNKNNPSLFSIHCVVHRQHFVAKELSVKLNHS